MQEVVGKEKEKEKRELIKLDIQKMLQKLLLQLKKSNK